MAECARLATEGLAAARASSTLMVQGPALSCLAYHAMHEGDLDRAGRLHEELLEMGRRQGEKWGMGIVLFDLALLRVVQGRPAQARGVVRRGHRPRPGIWRSAWHRLVSGDSFSRRGGGRTSTPGSPAPRRDGGSGRERRRTRSGELQPINRRSVSRRHEGFARRERPSSRIGRRTRDVALAGGSVRPGGAVKPFQVPRSRFQVRVHGSGARFGVRGSGSGFRFRHRGAVSGVHVLQRRRYVSSKPGQSSDPRASRQMGSGNEGARWIAGLSAVTRSKTQPLSGSARTASSAADGVGTRNPEP